MVSQAWLGAAIRPQGGQKEASVIPSRFLRVRVKPDRALLARVRPEGPFGGGLEGVEVSSHLTLRWREMDSAREELTLFPPHTVAETSPLADLWFRLRSGCNPCTSGEDGGGAFYRDRAQGLGRLVSKRSGSIQDSMA